MKSFAILLSSLFVCFSITAFAAEKAQAEAVPMIQKEDPLQRLLAGNQRYLDQKMEHCINTEMRRSETATLQKPFAAILCCSDSRVPPEVLFDQGIGDLFVVRIAGNLIDDFAKGSLEYAVKYLQVPFIFVLGHTNCGAIDAFLMQLRQNTHFIGHIEDLLLGIYPAAKLLKDVPNYTLNDLIIANVHVGVQTLKSTPPILDDSVARGQLRIEGGLYDLASGKVTLVESK